MLSDIDQIRRKREEREKKARNKKRIFSVVASITFVIVIVMFCTQCTNRESVNQELSSENNLLKEQLLDYKQQLKEAKEEDKTQGYICNVCGKQLKEKYEDSNTFAVIKSFDENIATTAEYKNLTSEFPSEYENCSTEQKLDLCLKFLNQNLEQIKGDNNYINIWFFDNVTINGGINQVIGVQANDFCTCGSKQPNANNNGGKIPGTGPSINQGGNDSSNPIVKPTVKYTIEALAEPSTIEVGDYSKLTAKCYQNNSLIESAEPNWEIVSGKDYGKLVKDGKTFYIEGIAEGKVVVKATYKTVSDSVEITVKDADIIKPRPEKNYDIEASASMYTIEPGEYSELYADCYYNGILQKNAEVQWKIIKGSRNAKLVRDGDTFYIEGVAEGDVVVKATYKSVSDSVEIRVKDTGNIKPEPEKYDIQASASDYVLKIGEEGTYSVYSNLFADVYKNGKLQNNVDVDWKIISGDNVGKLVIDGDTYSFKALNEGKVTIRASYKGAEDTVVITVIKETKPSDPVKPNDDNSSKPDDNNSSNPDDSSSEPDWEPSKLDTYVKANSEKQDEYVSIDISVEIPEFTGNIHSIINIPSEFEMVDDFKNYGYAYVAHFRTSLENMGKTFSISINETDRYYGSETTITL